MSKPKIIEKQALNNSFFKRELDAIKERDGELTFRGGKTEEHLNHIKPIEAEKAEEILKKLEELEIPRLKPEHMHKIIDIMPKSEAHLKIALQGYTLTVNDDNIKKIMEVVTEYLPKKK